MISPSVIALMVASAGSSLIGLRAGREAYGILERWNPASGSERQIRLEKGSFLMSFLMRTITLLELTTLAGFVAVADRLHPVLTGAMCAAGVLNAHPAGYPALALHAAVVFLGCLWLTLDLADAGTWDQPLVRLRAGLAVVTVLLVLVRTMCQWRFFLGIEPDVITSCCSLQFGASATGFAFGLAGLPPLQVEIVFFSICAMHLSAGAVFLGRGRAMAVFSGISALLLPVAILSILAFVSVSYYELPTHHCPFCILHPEYYCVGYAIYLSLLGSSTIGMGAGMLECFRARPSLKPVVPGLQRRLTVLSMACSSGLMALAAWPLMASDFVLT